MLRFAPGLAIFVLAGPVLFGILATLLPAFGYFPALGGDTFNLDPFRKLLEVPGIWQSAFISLLTGLAATATALTIVVLFVSGYHGTKLFSRMQHLISPLLSVPHAAAAFGLAFLIAPTGLIFRLLSPWATGSSRPLDLLIVNDSLGLTMIAGLVAKEIPFLLLVTLAALPQVKARRSVQVARSMGYGQQAAFMLTAWPQVYRQIRLAVFAVLAYSTSVVDVALILGPSAPASLAVRLTQWMNDADLSIRFLASAGAVLQLGVTAFAMIIWLIGERFMSFVMTRQVERGHRMAEDGPSRQFALALTGLFTLAIFTGLGLLIIWSFAGFWSFPDLLPRSFNLDTWRRILPGLGDLLSTTIVVAIAATAIAIFLALACLEREARTGKTGGNHALLLLYLPLIIPQVSFVFGVQLFVLYLGFDASIEILIFVHLIFVLPYVFLSLSDPWRAWDRRFASVAFGLGATPNRVFWRIRIPMLMRAILTASAVGFAVSIGQYLPTLLIGAGRLPTITTEAVALASGGNRRVVGAFALLQMGLPLLGFALASIIPVLLFARRRDMAVSS